MIQYLRERRAAPLIAKAVEAHAAFEIAHKAGMSHLIDLPGVTITHPPARTIVLPSGERRTRMLGEYDPDQRIERIVGEVERALGKKKAPKRLREMVEAAL